MYVFSNTDAYKKNLKTNPYSGSKCIHMCIFSGREVYIRFFFFFSILSILYVTRGAVRETGSSKPKCILTCYTYKVLQYYSVGRLKNPMTKLSVRRREFTKLIESRAIKRRSFCIIYYYYCNIQTKNPLYMRAI